MGVTVNPIDSASQAAQVVVEYGTLGAVLLGAGVCIAGLSLAVAILWRAREAAEQRCEAAQLAHYAWAVAEVQKQAEREHRQAEALQALSAATVSVRDLLVKLLERRDG
jgi:hypothetical protein